MLIESCCCETWSLLFPSFLLFIPLKAATSNSRVQSVDWLESIHQGNQLEINKTVQNQTGPSLRGKSSPSTNLAGTTRGERASAGGSAQIQPQKASLSPFAASENRLKTDRSDTRPRLGEPFKCELRLRMVRRVAADNLFIRPHSTARPPASLLLN